MEYKQFIVRVFEREPDKWREKILRFSGKPIFTGRKSVLQYITGVDRATPSAALLAALEAIDGGAFSRPATLPEQFWHRRSQHSHARTFNDRPISSVQRASQHSVKGTRLRG